MPVWVPILTKKCPMKLQETHHVEIHHHSFISQVAVIHIRGLLLWRYMTKTQVMRGCSMEGHGYLIHPGIGIFESDAVVYGSLILHG